MLSAVGMATHFGRHANCTRYAGREGDGSDHIGVFDFESYGFGIVGEGADKETRTRPHFLKSHFITANLLASFSFLCLGLRANDTRISVGGGGRAASFN